MNRYGNGSPALLQTWEMDQYHREYGKQWLSFSQKILAPHMAKTLNSNQSYKDRVKLLAAKQLFLYLKESDQLKVHLSWVERKNRRGGIRRKRLSDRLRFLICRVYAIKLIDEVWP